MLIGLAIVLVGILFAWKDISGQMREASCDNICQIYRDLPGEYEKTNTGWGYKLKQ
jgi:hypothetical protein